MQVIPSACNACPENRYEVTSSCMGCLAHPCQSVCPKGAISMKNGKSVIDQENVSSAENVVRSALMMLFAIKSVPVRLPAVLEPLHLTMWEEL